MAKGDSREELRARLAELAKADVAMVRSEEQAHDQKFQKLYAERDKLNDQINELVAKRNEIAERLAHEHIGPQNEIRQRLSQAARDSGGRFLSDVTA